MSGDVKVCGRCRQELPVSEFYRNAARSDGLSGYCCACQRDSETERAQKRRRAVVDAMGGRCVHCGFSDIRALQIDHVHGGGRAADPMRHTQGFYTKVLASPAEYQLLCANCNWIKKTENEEHVGRREYRRTPPTERRTGVGRHNPEANMRRADGLRRWREQNPDANSERARKGNATRRSRTMA